MSDVRDCNSETENSIYNIEFQELWADLRQAIEEICLFPRMKCSRYIELYDNVYGYCTRPSELENRNDESSGKYLHSESRLNFLGKRLYKRLRDFFETYLVLLFEDETELTDENVLEFYASRWKLYRFCARVLNGVCAYINRYWVPQELSLIHI